MSSIEGPRIASNVVTKSGYTVKIKNIAIFRKSNKNIE